jgi:hypothetical protein
MPQCTSDNLNRVGLPQLLSEELDTDNGGVTPDMRALLDDTAVEALSAGRDIVLEAAEPTLR